MRSVVEDVSALRASLRAAGYAPLALYNPDQVHTVGGVPIEEKSRGKVPLGAKWQEGESPRLDARALNTGLLSAGLQPVDIDVDDPQLARTIRDMALVRFGEAPMRCRGGSARCLLLYRAPPGMQPVKRAVAGPLGKVEVLGKGQQFHSFGTHYTGAELEWLPQGPDEIAFTDLPIAKYEEVAAFLAEVAPLLGVEPEANGAPRKPNGAHGPSRHGLVADVFEVSAALARIPNDGPGADWEAWNRVGMALYAATAGTSAGCDLFHAWSARHTAYDRNATDERWGHYATSPPTGIGAGTLFHLARQQQEEPQSDAAPVASTADMPPLFDPWDSLQPPPFSLMLVPPVIRAFVEERSRVIGADPCALSWAALSACSAAIDGRIRLKMKRHDGWTVPPFIWCALVGAPSTKKSPILDAAWGPLIRAQNIDLDAWRAEHAAWRALSKKERAEEPEPVCRRRLVSHDATIESLQDILNRQDRGIGVLRDELAGWIGSLEKYAGARGGAADRAFFLQAYNGNPYVADRVMRGTMPIGNLGLTIAGGIQPERLEQLGNLTADGLWQRFVPIIVGQASFGTDERADFSVAAYGELVDRLLRLPPQMLVQFSDAAQEVSRDIGRKIFELEQTGTIGSAFTAFCGKLHGTWGRLCLVMSQIELNDIPYVVSEDTAIMAHDLLFASLLPNAARIYASMGQAGADFEATRSVAGFILTKGKTRLVASDLTRNVRACRGQSLKSVQDTLSPLVAGGWLTPEDAWSPSVWHVSPAVHATFAKRARAETERRAAVRALLADHHGNDEEGE